MNSDKMKYRSFCKEESSLPIFSRDWWLDAVCGGDNWDAVILENNGVITAALPYFKKNKFIYHGTQLPPFTPQLGPWVKYPDNQKYLDRLNFEKDIFFQLIDKLPHFDFYIQAFDPSFTNWLPFYWRGFMQTTKYTYIIEDISDTDAVYENFNYAKKKNIKKAEKIVTIKYDIQAKEFYEYHKYTLLKQGDKIHYSFGLFEKVYNAAYDNDSGITIYAIDEQQNIHSALFVVWDKFSAYDLISAINPEYRGSGSASLLIKEIIKYTSLKTKRFDFEGSMIENVENSFKQFGAKQIPYFKIMKYNPLVLKIMKVIMG